MLFLALHATAKTEQVEIQGAVGKLVAAIQTPDVPTGKKMPMVILCHGFSSNKETGLLTTLADSLAAHGMASIRFDFNGHGKSEGSFENMTVLNEIEDAKCVYNYVRQLPWVSRVAMVGHSQGGVVTAMTSAELGKNCIAAEVLLAPAGVLRDDALRGYLFGKSYNPHDLPERAPVGGDLWLGREYARVAQTLPIYETARLYKGSALVIHGSYDVVVPYTYGERFHYVIKNSQFKLLPGLDHGFSNHEREVAHLACEFLRKVKL
ncbi:MAG: alpha/beta fold hydrolase [Prevotella sp.]|nr:alpha/beta fold hydrolase [Prevotella sp.]